MRTILVILIFLLSQVPVAAQQIEISTTFGSGADAMIRAGSNSNNNFGDVIGIAVKDEGPFSPVTRKSYFRFDLSELPASVTNAEIVLSVTTPDDPCSPTTPHVINVFGLSDLASSELWNEDLISWSNAPGNDTNSGNGVTAAATPLGSFANQCQFLIQGAQISFSSSALADFINSDTNDVVTIIFTDGSQISSSIGYATKENQKQHAPLLRLTLDVVLGDVNLDGSVDLLDVAAFIDRIQSGTYQIEADVNLDGEVDLLDVDPFVDLLDM